MLFGVGIKDDIKEVWDNGGLICWIVIYCIEVDVLIQYFGLVCELGLEIVGFLMMVYIIVLEKLVVQVCIMVDVGCQCVYVVDFVGVLVFDGVVDWVLVLVVEFGEDVQVGFYGYENFGFGVVNLVVVVCVGVKQIDGFCWCFGVGVGNVLVEVLIGVFDKIGVKIGIDFFDIVDVVEDVVCLVMLVECLFDCNVLIMGYFGVYFSFFKYVVCQVECYGVLVLVLLYWVGQCKFIGGQEDQFIDIVLEIKCELDSGVVVMY